MTEDAAAPLERARSLAAGARIVALAIAVIIIVAAVTREMALPALATLRAAEFTLDGAGVWRFVATALAHALLAIPSFMLAGALFQLRDVLDEYAEGRFFTRKASRGVRKAGESALLALAFKIVLSPTLFAYATGAPRGVIWHMESFDLGLVAFAAFVAIAGRVLEAAAAIKADSDQII